MNRRTSGSAFIAAYASRSGGVHSLSSNRSVSTLGTKN
jgi:hypothetical protein